VTTALDFVPLSRLQFGRTAIYHYLFVPLTLGLSVLLGLMEGAYVMIGREDGREPPGAWDSLAGPRGKVAAAGRPRRWALGTETFGGLDREMNKATRL
jgi:hypothetical protein